MQLNWQQPLNSNHGLKYLSMSWYIIGTTRPNANLQTHWRILYYIYATIANLFCGILFAASMLINIFFIDSYKELVANLSLSITVAMSIVKQMIVVWHRDLLLESKTYLKLLDESSDHHAEDRHKILSAIRHAQLYAIYYPLYISCGLGFTYTGWSHHELIYNAWMPDFFTNAEENFKAKFFYQCVSQIFVCFQNVFNDTYPMCYLTLMIGHLESLAARISRIGWDLRVHSTDDQNVEALKNCITDHKNLLRYFDCVRPIISATLCCQFMIAGLSMCMTALNLLFFNTNFNEQFFSIVYLFILMIQMFPCCWYVNDMMEKSAYLTTAMYSCNWMDQNLKFRKMLIIFMQRSQKANSIIAGGLAPVTLQTFLAIIRFTFSMFTIISKM